MKQAIVMAAVVGLMAASGVNAETVAKADPAKAQQIASTVCVACHGADGNSPAPANPKLASQHPDYLNKQLANFKSGERKSAIMAGMAAMLSPEDMKNVAAYFGGQKQAPSAAQDKARRACRPVAAVTALPVQASRRCSRAWPASMANIPLRS
jgi:cytochrome c553